MEQIFFCAYKDVLSMFMVGEHPPPGFFAVFAQFPRKLFCLRAIAAKILEID